MRRVLDRCVDDISILVDSLGDIVGDQQRGDGYPQKVERELLTSANPATASKALPND